MTAGLSARLTGYRSMVKCGKPVAGVVTNLAGVVGRHMGGTFAASGYAVMTTGATAKTFRMIKCGNRNPCLRRMTLVAVIGGGNMLSVFTGGYYTIMAGVTGLIAHDTVIKNSGCGYGEPGGFVATFARS